MGLKRNVKSSSFGNLRRLCLGNGAKQLYTVLLAISLLFMGGGVSMVRAAEGGWRDADAQVPLPSAGGILEDDSVFSLAQRYQQPPWDHEMTRWVSGVMKTVADEMDMKWMERISGGSGRRSYQERMGHFSNRIGGRFLGQPFDSYYPYQRNQIQQKMTVLGYRLRELVGLQYHKVKGGRRTLSALEAEVRELLAMAFLLHLRFLELEGMRSLEARSPRVAAAGGGALALVLGIFPWQVRLPLVDVVVRNPENLWSLLALSGVLGSTLGFLQEWRRHATWSKRLADAEIDENYLSNLLMAFPDRSSSSLSDYERAIDRASSFGSEKSEFVSSQDRDLLRSTLEAQADRLTQECYSLLVAGQMEFDDGE